MSIRRADLTVILTHDMMLTCQCLWIVETQQRIDGVALGKEADEPCVTLKWRKEPVVKLYDQKVTMDLDTMQFKVKDVDGKVLTLAFSTTPPPLPEPQKPATLP